MANRNTPYAIYDLHMFLITPNTHKSDLSNLLNINPRPWFTDEEEAYTELLDIVKFLDRVDDSLKVDARYKFFRHNIEHLFIDECPSYKLFWLMQREQVIDPIRDNACYKYIEKTLSKNNAK